MVDCRGCGVVLWLLIMVVLDQTDGGWKWIVGGRCYSGELGLMV